MNAENHGTVVDIMDSTSESIAAMAPVPHTEVNGLVNWEASLKTNLDRLERAIILAALHNAHGNKARAARALGITERIMGLRVRKYRINARAIRTGGYDCTADPTIR